MPIVMISKLKYNRKYILLLFVKAKLIKKKLSEIRRNNFIKKHYYYIFTRHGNFRKTALCVI